MAFRLHHHRRFTANHTTYLDWGRRRLFIKIIPSRRDAAAEIDGHGRLAGWYPVPRLRSHRSLGPYALIAYERHGTGDVDDGLLLDAINATDASGAPGGLGSLLTVVLRQYRHVIGETVCRVPLHRTVTKLYGDRARPGGRLDRYYRNDQPLFLLPGGEPLRPSDLWQTVLVVNGREYRIDFDDVLASLRDKLTAAVPVWAAVTQGDPTDMNIGKGPIWFDYDTGGLNALAGEFACFLWYQRLQGGWLVPRNNAAAFADHPRTFACLDGNRPDVRVRRTGRRVVEINYRHRPSPARQYVLGRYLDELVYPIANELGIPNFLAWLRPYLTLRILGVYRLGDLAPSDAALSLAYLAETLTSSLRLRQLLGLAEVNHHGAVRKEAMPDGLDRSAAALTVGNQSPRNLA